MQCKNTVPTKKDLEIIKQENSRFKSGLDLNDVSKICDEFTNRFAETSCTIPVQLKKYKYYYTQKKQENYGIYYYIDQDEKHHELLNEIKLAKNKSFFALTKLLVSQNEDFFVFSVDYVGDNVTSLYVNFFNNKNILICDKSSSRFVIDKCSNHVYYIMESNTLRPYKLCKYDVVTRKENIIFETTNNYDTVNLYNSSDLQEILIKCTQQNKSNIYIVKPNNNLQPLFPKDTIVVSKIEHYLDWWYLLMNNKVYKTQNFKQITYVTQCDNIESFFIKGGFLIFICRDNGFLHLHTFDVSNNTCRILNFGKKRYSLTVPELENMNVFDPHLILQISTFTQPPKIVLLDLRQQKIVKIQNDYKLNYKPLIIYEEKLVQVSQNLHLTMIFKKSEFKKPMSCLLYGYGSYGAVEDPFFNPYLPSLLDRGFLYCVAHVRGSGFNGDKWYEKGKLLNKKNSFDDFIKCARFLINNNYTVSQKLCIWGRSAGGLLIGASINETPSLFNSAIMGVPFLEVSKTMQDPCLPLVTQEYTEWGNPKNKKMKKYMQSYSPIDNINLRNDYPHILLYSNINDGNVPFKEPLHYFEKMKHASVFESGDKHINLWIKLKYGHGQSSKRYEKAEEMAHIYSYIINKNV